MRFRTPYLAWLLLLAPSAWADPLDGALDIGASLSHSYEARNIFLNPAALGYETVLNGAGAHSSFAFAPNREGVPSDLAFALAWGPFGAGAERLAVQQLSRYRVAVGSALTSHLYLGARFNSLHFDNGAVRGDWDLGLQLRPGQRVAVGAMLYSVGRASMWGALGATLRPFDRLEFSADLGIPISAPMPTPSYQAAVGLEMAPGVKLRAGYHSTYQWLAGFQFHFGHTSAFGSTQPDSENRRVLIGFQSSTSPYKSVLGSSKTVSLTLGENLSESGYPGGLFLPARPSHLQVLQTLLELTTDPSVRSVLIKLDRFPLGLAAAQEAHQALRKLRAAGKSVEVFLGNAGLKEYLIASAATRITMDPSGELRWLGLRQERYFLKGTLDKLGVEGEFLAAGEFKSAPEAFLRKSSSEQAKKAALDELESLEQAVYAALDSTGRLDPSQRKRLDDLGVASAGELLKLGLIDNQAAFQSTLAERERTQWVLGPHKVRRDSIALPRRVAVVVASGNILPDGLGGWALAGGRQVTPSAMDKKLRMASEDSRTLATVLRVSSPGGEVLASERIAARVRDASRIKPLVVSMGDVAASGGYYIAAPGRRVFANPLSVTGSIGVFLGKFSLAGLYSKIDLKKEILTTGRYPGLLSEDRPWSDKERSIMQRRLESYFDGFVAHVAENRGLSAEQAKLLATGRVWTGAVAEKQKLVDSVGGYMEAIEFAASEAGLETGEYEIWEVEPPASLFEVVPGGGAFNLKAGWLGAGSALPPWLPEALAAEVDLALALEQSPYLYLAPAGPPQP